MVRRLSTIYFVAVAAIGTVAYFAFAKGSLGQAWVLVALNASVLPAVVFGVARRRPERSMFWLLVLVGYVIDLVAWIGWYVRPLIVDQRVAFPSMFDAMFLVADGCFGAALIALTRARSSERGRASLIDSTIVALGVSALSWVLLVEPVLEREHSGWAKAVSLAFPIAGAIFVALTIKLVLTGINDRRVSLMFVGGWLVCQIMAESAFSYTGTRDTFEFGHALFAGWIVSYACIGAAALHPDMASLTAKVQAASALTRRRIGALAAASLLGPTVIVIHDIRSIEIDVALIAAVSALTFILVLVRAYDLMVDIEEYQGVQTQLAASELKLRSFLEALPIGVIVMGRDYQVHFANSTATKWMGDEVASADLDDMVEPRMSYISGTDQVYPPERYPIAVALGGEECSDDMDVDLPGGRVTYHVSACPVRDGDGEVLFSVASLDDVTDERNNARQLAEQAHELERSNGELEQFAYVASHDLQEPLRIVSSYCQLLQKRYGGQLDDDADEFIGYAVDATQRMKQLIQDLLMYSRVGTKAKSLEPSDARTIVDQALANLAITIEETGAVVECGDLPTVLGDSVQLTQLFQNLVANAIKFQSTAKPYVTITADQRGAEVEFSVRDNGIGIDPQYANRIFTIFQRLHTREEYAGTGIGLAVCKKIVERHGGRIWVESAPGEGSDFHFTLRASRQRSLVGVAS